MSYILNNNNQKIHYRKISGKTPGIIFIHGLNSDMGGKKAISIEKYAKNNRLNFIRFDCRGHGKSDGKFEDFTISDWKNDLLNIIDNVAKGPQILVGSSMGGWLMFLAAKKRPSKIKGMIGLAAAPDYINEFYKNDEKDLFKATVIAEPIERGFGGTIGNALRRILLSSLQDNNNAFAYLNATLL